MARVIIFCLTLILIGCKSSKNLSTVESKQSTIKDEVSIKERQGEVLWSNNTVSILYSFENSKESGETKLTLFSEDNNKIIQVVSDDDASLSSPYSIDSDGETFFVIFETWHGSGNLNEKLFFHLNKKTLEINPVQITTVEDIITKTKKKFELTDSLFTRKGEWYHHSGANSKDIFDQNGNLSFHLMLYKKEDGYTIKKYLLSGTYEFRRIHSIYTLVPTNLELSSPD